MQRLLTDVERLDEAARQTKGRYSEVGVSRVSTKLREVVKELDEDEAAGLASVLKFENLPPLEKWPDPVFGPEPERAGVKPDRLDLNPDEDSAAKEREKRKRLRYHNLVVVDPKVSKAAPRRADEKWVE